ncbi:MAG: dUTP diphosphatase [Oscillospiraceae bacterium]|nr:dUTP diphosphatase [Oscillospiraceae bacterium]
MSGIIKAVKLRENAQLPTYGSEFAAGADLRACIDSDIELQPHETRMIPTGIAVEIPGGYAGLVCARSGLASKKGLAPANKVGVIDSDYRGELIVALHNHSGIPASVSPGERVAQLLITPVLTPEFVFVQENELSGTDRGTGGFGSTGTR